MKARRTASALALEPPIGKVMRFPYHNSLSDIQLNVKKAEQFCVRCPTLPSESRDLLTTLSAGITSVILIHKRTTWPTAKEGPFQGLLCVTGENQACLIVSNREGIRYSRDVMPYLKTGGVIHTDKNSIVIADRERERLLFAKLRKEALTLDNESMQSVDLIGLVPNRVVMDTRQRQVIVATTGRITTIGLATWHKCNIKLEEGDVDVMQCALRIQRMTVLPA